MADHHVETLHQHSKVAESSNSEILSPEDLNSAESLAARLPQKRYFRQRAHANPFSDHLLE